MTGDTLGWDDLRDGRPLVAVFWATWCSVCKKEWPRLQELHRRYAEVPGAPAWTAISLGEPAGEVERVARERDLPGTWIADPREENGESLGIRFVPTVYVLDADGRLVYHGKSDVPKLDRILERLTRSSTETTGGER